jgi:hypothetical protein
MHYEPHAHAGTAVGWDWMIFLPPTLRCCRRTDRTVERSSSSSAQVLIPNIHFVQHVQQTLYSIDISKQNKRYPPTHQPNPCAMHTTCSALLVAVTACIAGCLIVKVRRIQFHVLVGGGTDREHLSHDGAQSHTYTRSRMCAHTRLRTHTRKYHARICHARNTSLARRTHHKRSRRAIASGWG